jgi:hypothetical protein
MFVKDIPQVVEGDKEVAFFKGREEFSVREIVALKEEPPEPVIEEEPEVEEVLDDSDLPPPAEEGKLSEDEVVEEAPAPSPSKVVKKIVKKKKS